MVTKGTSRRSTRCFRSAGLSFSGRAAAWDRVSGEKRCGTSYLRTAISISMPGSSISPSTSLTRPTGCEYIEAGSVSSTATTWPHGRIGNAVLGNQDVLAVAPSSGATSQTPFSKSRRR
jgi:hypothetical protein